MHEDIAEHLGIPDQILLVNVDAFMSDQLVFQPEDASLREDGEDEVFGGRRGDTDKPALV